jgi:DNA-binding Lrp family transcriptional regulator
MVTAIVLIQTERGRVEEVAQDLLEVDEVSEVYLVAGNYDLVALVRVRQYEQMAALVPGRLARIDGIVRTRTLMAFQAYSRHDLERLWSVGVDEELATRQRAEQDSV